MKKLITLLGISLIAMGAIGFAVAGDTDIHVSEASETSPVKIGVYRDLTWYRKLKLGTAAYVNPRLLTNASVVYTYNTQDIPVAMTRGLVDATMASWKTVGPMIKDGVVAAAYYNGETWGIVDQNEFYSIVQDILQKMGLKVENLKPKDLDNSTAVATWKGLKYQTVVSANNNLWGMRPSGTLVSWHAVEPVGLDVKYYPSALKSPIEPKAK